MKKLTKGLILVLCAAVLVAGSIMGTLAWLTDESNTITNTFTVGNIQITLTQNDIMDKKLIPGTKIEMNAKVTVEKGSEECYLFVKVENEISEIQQTIEGQLTANGWEKLNGVANVYYKNAIPASNQDAEYKVFESFEIAESASSNDLTGYNNKKIVIKAYAVQTSGFTSASQAWEQTFGASNQSQPNDQNSQ